MKENRSMLINERKLRSIVRSVIRESFGGVDRKQEALMALKQAIKIASPKSPKGSNKLYRDRPDLSLSFTGATGPDGCAMAKLIIKTFTTTSSLGVCLYDDRIEIVYNKRGERAVYFTQLITPEQIINGGASKLASDIVRAHGANWYYQPPQPPENSFDDDDDFEDDSYDHDVVLNNPNLDDDFDDDSYDDWNDDSQLAQDNRYARELANKADETSYEEELAALKARYGK